MATLQIDPLPLMPDGPVPFDHVMGKLEGHLLIGGGIFVERDRPTDGLKIYKMQWVTGITVGGGSPPLAERATRCRLSLSSCRSQRTESAGVVDCRGDTFRPKLVMACPHVFQPLVRAPLLVGPAPVGPQFRAPRHSLYLPPNIISTLLHKPNPQLSK